MKLKIDDGKNKRGIEVGIAKKAFIRKKNLLIPHNISLEMKVFLWSVVLHGSETRTIGDGGKTNQIRVV